MTAATDASIHVRARRRCEGVEVVSGNDCAPIAEPDRLHLCERFYRGDPARSRRVDGSGLGLSLAREIARADGGDVTLEPSAPDQVRLRVWLPTR